MTEKNLAAHRENGRKSRGAATAAGNERARAANLRHGFYSRETDQALEALGERPGTWRRPPLFNLAVLLYAEPQTATAAVSATWFVTRRSPLVTAILRCIRIC